MNQNECVQLRGLWAMYAAYYRQNLQDEIIVMYAEDLADLEFSAVKAALDSYRKNPKNKFMPMPAQIRELINPEIDVESAAREIAARVNGAVPKYGWNNSTDARNFIGEAGWSIVNRLGGWNYVCEHHGLRIDPSAFQAQVRELAKSELQFSHQQMENRIFIPGPDRSTDQPALLEYRKEKL